jgi:glutamate-1-semialdehyde 2,1-aminomutase
VMTGFRVAPGGAQGLYSITPDLTCLGKVVAGGASAAAYGGREDLMRMIAPDGPVYQAGTLAGNPLATAAGIACLSHLTNNPGVYDELEAVGTKLEKALADALDRSGVAGCVQRVGAMMTVFLGPNVVANWDDTAAIDRDLFARFFQGAYERGVLLPPSPFEALFLMQAHGEVIDEATAALVDAIEGLS